jgi:hypothetical protein
MLMQRRRAATRLTEYAKFIDIPGVPLPDLNPLLEDQFTEDAAGRLGAEFDEVADQSYMVVETELAAHHILLLNACQDMVDGNLQYYIDDDGECWPYTAGCGYARQICRRVMVMMPPGSAKSTYGTVVFPTWEMGRKPGLEVILTGYGDTICKRHGKRARQICASRGYRSVFGVNVNPDTRAADNWETETSSSYKSAGILSGITGFRCDGLIWDDITKGRKEADSETIREDTYNAYIDDARSRKKPLAWELGIGTRWHEDETMGRLLPEGYAGESGYMVCRDGNVWYVLCMPAQCEREDDVLHREIGEYIWPEWFGEGYWNDKKINPRSWASLYQQRPALEEGLFFKREWDRRWNVRPPNVNHYLAFDSAVSAEENADDTCIEVWCVDEYAKCYKLDEWYGHVTMDIWIPQLITLGKIYRPMEIIGETGVIRRASEPYILREMREQNAYFTFEWVSRNADKSAMARPYQAMMSAGNIYFPPDSIGDKTIDELMRFPASKQDHRVDAGANFFLRLEVLWAASPPRKKTDDRGVLTHGVPIKKLMPPRFRKKKY